MQLTDKHTTRNSNLYGHWKSCVFFYEIADSKELEPRTPNSWSVNNRFIVIELINSDICKLDNNLLGALGENTRHKTTLSREVSRVVAVRNCEEYPSDRACSYVDAQQVYGPDYARVVSSCSRRDERQVPEGWSSSNIVCKSSYGVGAKQPPPLRGNRSFVRAWSPGGGISGNHGTVLKQDRHREGKTRYVGLCPHIGVSPLEAQH